MGDPPGSPTHLSVPETHRERLAPSHTHLHSFSMHNHHVPTRCLLIHDGSPEELGDGSAVSVQGLRSFLHSSQNEPFCVPPSCPPFPGMRTVQVSEGIFAAQWGDLMKEPGGLCCETFSFMVGKAPLHGFHPSDTTGDAEGPWGCHCPQMQAIDPLSLSEVLHFHMKILPEDTSCVDRCFSLIRPAFTPLFLWKTLKSWSPSLGYIILLRVPQLCFSLYGKVCLLITGGLSVDPTRCHPHWGYACVSGA